MITDPCVFETDHKQGNVRLDDVKAKLKQASHRDDRNVCCIHM